MFVKVVQGVRKVDMFGYPIGLRLNRQSMYKTKLGGCTSITLLIILFMIFSSNFIDFIQKQQLKVTAVVEYEDSPEQIQLDEAGFMIAVSIQQDDFILNPYFNVTLTQMYYQLNEDGSRVKAHSNIPLIPCTVDRFQTPFDKYGKNITTDFTRMKLDQFLCPNYNSTINLQGTYTNAQFEFLKISVTDCSDTEPSLDEWNPTCRSQQDIEDYLDANGQFTLQVYTINQIISPEKPNDQYLQMFIDDSLHLNFVPSKLNKYANVFMKNYQFFNDDSLLPYSNIQVRSVFTIDQADTQETTQFPIDKSSDHSAYYLRRSPFKTKVERSYLKLDELLSNLGGIQQIFFFTIGVLVSYYNRLQLTVELANRVYEFQFDSVSKQRENQENLQMINELAKIKQIFKRSDTEQSLQEQPAQILNKSEIRQKQNNEQHLNFNSNVIESKRAINIDEILEPQEPEPFEMHKDQRNNELLKKHRQMAIKLKCKSGLEYFQKQILRIINRARPIPFGGKMLINYLTLNKCFSSNKEVILMRKALLEIQDSIDLYQILRKLNEIDKLKETLLTYKQQLLFGFTPRPQIAIDDREREPSRNLLEQKLKSPTISILERNQTLQENFQLFSTPANTQQTDEDYFMYAKIYSAYDDILQASEQTTSKTHYINKQLINQLGDELQMVFKISKLLDIQFKSIKSKSKQKVRRGGMQQVEDDIFLKLFDQEV